MLKKRRKKNKTKKQGQKIIIETGNPRTQLEKARKGPRPLRAPLPDKRPAKPWWCLNTGMGAETGRFLKDDAVLRILPWAGRAAVTQ